jgi:hypothetical protein
MKKILLLLLLLSSSIFALDTTGVWKSNSSTDANNVANYGWTPAAPAALSSNCILIFKDTTGITEANATFTADASIKSLQSISGFAGNISWSGRILTFAGDLTLDDNHTLNAGNGVVFNGASSTCHIGSGIGTGDATSCNITFNGTTGCVLDDDKGIKFAKLILGSSAILTVSGSANSIFVGNPVLTFTSGGTLTLNRQCQFNNNGSGKMISISGSPTINGTGEYRFQTDGNNLLDTMPAFTHTGSGIITFAPAFDSKTGNKIFLGGAFVCGDGLAINNYYTGATLRFYTLNNSITATGGISFGCSNTTDSLQTVWGSSAISCASVNATSLNSSVCIDSFQTSKWIVAGNITLPSTHTIVPGSSVFTVTAASTITSNSKQFWSIRDSANAGTLTFGDAPNFLDDFVTLSSCGGAVTWAGYTLTCAGDVVMDHTGTLNMGTGVTMSGASFLLHTGSTMGTITSSSDINITGNNGTIDFDKSNTMKSLTIANSVTVTNSGSAISIYTNSGNALVMGTNSSLITNATTNLNRSNNGDLFSLGAGYSISGTGAFNFNVIGANVKINIPAISSSTSGAVTIRGNAAGDTVIFTGTYSFPSAALNINSNSATVQTMIDFNDNNITCTSLRLGVSPALTTGTINYYFGNGTINCNLFNSATDNNATNINYEGATIYCSGNWSNGSAHNVNYGTSTAIVDSISTVTSANKAFYNFKIAAPSSGTVTLADSLTCLGNLIDSLGKFKSGNNNINLAGDFYRYSADSMLLGTSSVTTSKTNAIWYRRAGTSAPIGGLSSASFFSNGGSKFDVDTTKGAANKKFQFTPTFNRNFKCSTYVAGDLDNDSLISMTAGQKAYLNLPANTAIQGAYIKDIYAINRIYDTSATAINGGNDSNIVFRSATGQYYLTPTTVTVTSAAPAYMRLAGGLPDTITGTGFWAPCSVSVAGGAYIGATVLDSTKIVFTAPSTTAGVKSITVKNIEGVTGSGNVLTYLAMPGPISYTTPVIDTIGVAASHPVTITGTADSFIVRSTLPTGLSLTKATGLISGTPTVATGAADYTVVAYNAAGSDSTTINITVISGCAYSIPVITSITKPYGKASAPGVVTIRGSGLAGIDTVWYGSNVGVKIGPKTDTTLIDTVPNGTAGRVSVIVKSCAGMDTLVNGFTYTGAVYGVSVTPTSGLIAGGTSLSFRAAYGLTGSTIDSVDSWTPTSDTTATGTSLAHAAGSVRWVITSGSDTASVGYRYSSGSNRRRTVFGFDLGGFRF